MGTACAEMSSRYLAEHERAWKADGEHEKQMRVVTAVVNGVNAWMYGNKQTVKIYACEELEMCGRLNQRRNGSQACGRPR